MTAALVSFIALFALLFFGIPLAFALGLVGLVAFALAIGTHAASAMAAQITWDTLTSYSLSVLPLFVLMGNFVNHSGLSRQLYDASNAFIGHRRGGLAMATIMASGGFAAVCGSSIATAATISTVALPSMRRYGYSPALSTGSIAAGGTLGILIPPSVIMVIYGSMTETSIGHLFIAGIVPGILGVLFYMAAVGIFTYVNPSAGPAGPRVSWPERFVALRQVWMVLTLFLVVIGGIYLGVFTPTEAAGIGATGAFIAALLRRSMTFGEVRANPVRQRPHFCGAHGRSCRRTDILEFHQYHRRAGNHCRCAQGHRRAAARGNGLDSRVLSSARLRIRRTRHDPADRADFLSARHGARLRPGLVRNHHGRRRRVEPDHAADRNEPVCHSLGCARNSHDDDL
jgi:TRAP-type uncharacterized transport system fused permease subunit